MFCRKRLSLFRCGREVTRKCCHANKQWKRHLLHPFGTISRHGHGWKSESQCVIEKTSSGQTHAHLFLSVKVFANTMPAMEQLDKSEWSIISFCMSSVLTGCKAAPTMAMKGKKAFFGRYSKVKRKKSVKNSNGHKIQLRRCSKSEQSKSKMMKKSLSMWMWIIISTCCDGKLCIWQSANHSIE